MSHVAAQVTKKGQPLFTDLVCLEKAANLKGFEIVNQKNYTWWGHHVGDYPVPPGMKVEELGNNALFILRMNADKLAEFQKLHGKGTQPYDIGVIADPNNEGAYTLIYDFYGGGKGIDALLGAPVRQGGQITMLCPELKQTYDMVCEAQGAKEAGDLITFLTLAAARIQHPELFANHPVQANEEKIMLSLTDTRQRLGV